MKKGFYIGVICLLAASLQAEADSVSVSGGNTVAIVKKAEIASATGWQLLVVPVKGMNIAEGNNPTSHQTLAALLPPAEYEGYSVTVVSVPSTTAKEGVTLTASGYTYSVSDSNWTTTTQGASATDVFPSGTILWLKKPVTQAVSLLSAPKTQGDDDSTSILLFFGNSNGTATLPSATGGKVIAFGNDSTATLKINAINAPAGAQLFRIQAGKTTYERYYRVNVRGALQWRKLVERKIGEDTVTSEQVVGDTEEIAAAEAYYYYAQ